MIKKVYISIFILIFVLAIFSAWVLLSSFAFEKITKLALSKYVDANDIVIGKMEGNLLNGAKIKDIQISRIKGVNPGFILKIQEVDFLLPCLNPNNLELRVTNARFELSKGNPLVIQGTYQKKMLDFNVYSGNIDLRQLFNLFPGRDWLNQISGTVVNSDIYIKGSWTRKEISGKLIIKEGYFREFYLTDCPLEIKGNLENERQQLRVLGNVALQKGGLVIRKTGIIIERGKITIPGSFNQSIFDLKGNSTIGNTKINIIFKGTLSAPDLQLNSDPPLPKETLLIMLATGEPWEGLKGAASSGQLSPNIIRDFVDYFLLGGSGSKLAGELGISDISLTYTSQTKGIKATTPITGNVGVTYGVEQQQTQGKQPTTNYEVGAEIKVAPGVSVEAERKIPQPSTKEPLQEPAQPDDKVMLKFKKKF